MTGVMSVYRSTIGKKVVMALTGLIWIGYVIVHIWGNLKVYAGAAAFNDYAAALRYLGEPVLGYYQGIWGARIILLLAVGLHIWAAVSLWRQSDQGRPVKYGTLQKTQPAYTYAAYTMRWGGVIIALFIVFHILHLTIGMGGFGYATTFMHPEGGEYFAYQNLVSGFMVPWVSIVYIIAMIALGFHLFHGTWSLFQTLGVNNTSYSNSLRTIAFVLAAAITLAAISIPVSVMLGIISL
jgi:succinate dehydrogenase / fumarate reductase cytochrome b subunit